MRWTLTKPHESPELKAGDPYGEEIQRNVLLSKLQDLVAWGRKNSMWPFNFGHPCTYMSTGKNLSTPCTTL